MVQEAERVVLCSTPAVSSLKCPWTRATSAQIAPSVVSLLLTPNMWDVFQCGEAL